MTYLVKEIFGPTIQGEGSLVGKPTMFVRFGGCNMWSGREEDRHTSSRCPFCDTDFLGGERMTEQGILQELLYADRARCQWVTLSGGEPLLQIDETLCKLLQHAGYRVAVETNGATPPKGDVLKFVDKVVMSPKVPIDKIKLNQCDDLKVLFPHRDPEMTPESFAKFPAEERWLQPVNFSDGLDNRNVKACVKKVFEMNAATTTSKRWGVSIQTHKVMGVK